MKGTATNDRAATTAEGAAFLARLRTLLEKTTHRLELLRSADHELRVMTIRSHTVVGHTRKTFTKVYLAKVRTKRRQPTDPAPSPTPAGIILQKLRAKRKAKARGASA